MIKDKRMKTKVHAIRKNKQLFLHEYNVYRIKMMIKMKRDKSY